MCPFRGSLRQTLSSPRRFISHPLLPLNSQETAAPWNLGPCELAAWPQLLPPIPSALALKLRASGFQFPLGELPLGFGGGKRMVAGLQASGTNSFNVCRASSPASLNSATYNVTFSSLLQMSLDVHPCTSTQRVSLDPLQVTECWVRQPDPCCGEESLCILWGFQQ